MTTFQSFSFLLQTPRIQSVESATVLEDTVHTLEIETFVCGCLDYFPSLSLQMQDTAQLSSILSKILSPY